MKALLKIVLLLTFLMATLFYNIRFSYLLAFHSLNNESFTELYCVNKDKPELECNGQCSLADASQDSNSNENPGRLKNFQKEIQLFFSFKSIGEVALQKIEVNTPEISYQNDYNFLFSGLALRPPIGQS